MIIAPPPRRAWAAVLAAAAVLALGGCAGLSGGGTPEEQVSRLAQQRWDALIKGDFDTAYGYLQPGYRAVRTAEAYKKGFGSAGQWKSAEVGTVTCEPERCKVRIRIVTRNLAPQMAGRIPEISGVMEETWVRDESRWWFYEAL